MYEIYYQCMKYVYLLRCICEISMYLVESHVSKMYELLLVDPFRKMVFEIRVRLLNN